MRSDLDNVLAFDVVNGDAEHLSSYEIWDVDVLDGWGRHREDDVGVGVEGDRVSIRLNGTVVEILVEGCRVYYCIRNVLSYSRGV